MIRFASHGPLSAVERDAAPRRSLESLGDEIARVSAHIQAATYRLLCMIREFDEREGWHAEGFKSCAQWLGWRTGITPGAAREKVRVARALASLPHLSEALRAGRMSYSAARALTRVATPENEEELAEVARHTPAAQLERLVAGWRALDRASDPEAERERHAQRELSVVPDPDGSWVIRGRLDPEVGAALCRALDAAEAALYAGGGQTPTPPPGGAIDPDSPAAARRADALGLVAEAALGGGLGGGPEDGPEPERPEPLPVVGRAERFQVVVHVSAETLSDSGPGTADPRLDGDGDVSAETPHESRIEGGPCESRIEGGPHVAAETSRRLACDAGVVIMTHAPDGDVLNVGRKTRAVPPALRRALDRRDGGCRFPGCASRFCDAHHLRHWADGGETKLENLVLLCRRHHRLVHEEGWRVEIRAGADVRFYRPDGRRLPGVPAPPPLAGRVGADPVAALEREQAALGIDSRTPTPRWLGDPLDLDWALFTLWRPRPDVSAETPAGAG